MEKLFVYILACVLIVGVLAFASATLDKAQAVRQQKAPTECKLLEE